MVRSNAKIFLGKDVIYCFLFRIESSYAELIHGYNLKYMVSRPFESPNLTILWLFHA